MWRIGKVTAQEAQYAAGARQVAESKPRPPSASGRCALARAAAGRGPDCASSARVAEVARSWSTAKLFVSAGGILRRA